MQRPTAADRRLQLRREAAAVDRRDAGEQPEAEEPRDADPLDLARGMELGEQFATVLAKLVPFSAVSAPIL